MPACTIRGVFSSILFYFFLLSPVRCVTETHGRHIYKIHNTTEAGVWLWFIEG